MARKQNSLHMYIVQGTRVAHGSDYFALDGGRGQKNLHKHKYKQGDNTQASQVRRVFDLYIQTYHYEKIKQQSMTECFIKILKLMNFSAKLSRSKNNVWKKGLVIALTLTERSVKPRAKCSEVSIKQSLKKILIEEGFFSARLDVLGRRAFIRWREDTNSRIWGKSWNLVESVIGFKRYVGGERSRLILFIYIIIRFFDKWILYYLLLNFGSMHRIYYAPRTTYNTYLVEVTS